MDPQVVVTVVQAVETVHSSRAAPGDRHAAQAYLELLKDSPGQAAEYGVALGSCGSGHSDAVRHYGLHLVEHTVRYNWGVLDPAQQDSLKTAALGLVAGGTRGVLEEPVFIKEKVVRAVVEMAKRQWPQAWPSLLPDLITICKMGDHQTELVLLIFRSLAEDLHVFDLDDLSAVRKKELVTTLRDEVAPGLMVFCREVLEKQAAAVLQAPDNSGAQRAHLAILRAVLDVFVAFFNWLSIKLVLDNNLAMSLCELMRWPSLRMAACEALLALLESKRPKEERGELMHVFGGMWQLHGAASQACESENEADYMFLKRITQALCVLGQLLCEHVHDPAAAPPNVDLYMRTMLMLTGHTSLVVPLITLPFWTALIEKANPLRTAPEVVQGYPILLDSLLQAIVKTGQPDADEDTPRSRYNQMDFESDEEWTEVYSTGKGPCLQIARAIARQEPQAAFQLVLSWLTQAITDIPDSAIFGAPRVPPAFYVRWDALTAMCEKVISGVLDERERRLENGAAVAAIDEAVRTAYASFESFAPQDPVLLSSYFNVMNSFIQYLNRNPSLLRAYVEKVFGYTAYMQPGEGVTPTGRFEGSEVSQNVRRTACHNWLKLCMCASDTLLPTLEYLTHVEADRWRNGAWGWAERASIWEGLIIISNALRNHDRQRQYAEQLYNQVATQWTSAEMTQALGSPAAFLVFSGLDQPLGGAVLDETRTRNRIMMTGLLRILYAGLARSALPRGEREQARGGFVDSNKEPRLPMAGIVRAWLPNVLALVRCLHLLYAPEVRMQLQPHWEAVLEMGEREALWRLAQNRYTKEVADSASEEVITLRRWLDTARETSYLVFSHLFDAGSPLYDVTNLPHVLSQTLFCGLEVMQERHLRIMVRHVCRALITKCPAARYTDVLAEVLPNLVHWVTVRLNSEWQQAAARAQGHQGLESVDSRGNEMAEVVEAQLVTDISRNVLDTWYAIVIPPVHKEGETKSADKGRGRDKQAPPEFHSGLQRFTLRSKTVAESLEALFFSALTWGDSLSSLRATQMALHAAPYFARYSAAPRGEWAVPLMGAALEALRMHGQHPDNATQIIRLIVRLYGEAMPSNQPVRQALRTLPHVNEALLDALETHIKDGANKPAFETCKAMRPVGQVHKKERHVLELPQLQSLKASAPAANDDVDTVARFDLLFGE